MSFLTYLKAKISLPALAQATVLGFLAFALTNFLIAIEEFEVKDTIFPIAVFAYVYIKNGTGMSDLPTSEKLAKEDKIADKEVEEENKKAPRLGRSVEYIMGTAPRTNLSASSGDNGAVPDAVVIFMWQTWCRHCEKSFVPLIDTIRSFGSGSVHCLCLTSACDAKDVEKYVADKKIQFLAGLCKSGTMSVGIDIEGRINRELQDQEQKGAKKKTVPHSFVVFKGEIVWDGHPTGLESVLNYYVGGDSDSDSDSGSGSDE